MPINAARPHREAVTTTPTEQGDTPTSRNPWRRPMPTWAAMMWTTLVVTAVVLFLALVVNPATDSSRQPIRACEAWVLDQLVAPASAKFSSEQWFDGASAAVIGNVDSQNSFGAMLRSGFHCDMVHGADGWS